MFKVHGKKGRRMVLGKENGKEVAFWIRNVPDDEADKIAEERPGRRKRDKRGREYFERDAKDNREVLYRILCRAWGVCENFVLEPEDDESAKAFSEHLGRDIAVDESCVFHNVELPDEFKYYLLSESPAVFNTVSNLWNDFCEGRQAEEARDDQNLGSGSPGG